jgi:hypothetical protein
VGALGLLLSALLDTSAATADEAVQVRFAHLSPDSPAVDVALAPVPADGGPLTEPGPDVATGLAYGDVGTYQGLAPGSYAVSVRAAGSSSDTPPALSARIDVPAGTVRTVTLTGLFADLALDPLPDDLSAPPAGRARVRVLAAASGADPVTVTTGGLALAEELPFPAAGRYVDVPAGRAEVSVGDAAPVPVELIAGSVVTLLVLDDGDGVVLRPVVDAAGPPVVPAGGVDAGTGPVAVPAGLLVVLALAALRRTRGAVLVVAAATTALVPVGASRAVAAPPAVTASTTAAVAPPVRVRAPGIDAAVSSVGLDADGTLAVPGDPAVAGWLAAGVAPGGTGPAVLAGHVDWGGAPAVFAALGELRPGDEVAVERADGSVVRFAVTRVERVAKDAFPAAEVYGPTPDAQLRLITCGGRFDRAAGSYEDNVVVHAVVR